MDLAAGTIVATANVASSLSRADARRALAAVLACEPDLVGLQEWWPTRAALLRETGSVATVPPTGPRRRGRGDYLWCRPLVGDCVVGARAGRFDLIDARLRLLAPPAFADRSDRPLGLEPPRFATVGVYRDRRLERTVALVCHHLSPGVQAPDDHYRRDRPRLAARHRREVARLEQLVEEQHRLGRDVYVVGDSNLHGLRIAGLVSAWDGRDDQPGTFGPRRRIDDVFAATRPASVSRLDIGSDHRAVVATWAERPGARPDSLPT